MCGETRIPRDMCAGNTIPGETRIPMTPVQAKRDKPWKRFLLDFLIPINFGTLYVSMPIDCVYIIYARINS